MTAADKLRELLATRPAGPNTEELQRWWKATGMLLPGLLEDLEALDCDLVATRAELRRERDDRAYLRVELDRERIQHTADNQGSASALAQEAHEKAILEQAVSYLNDRLERALKHPASWLDCPECKSLSKAGACPPRCDVWVAMEAARG